LTDGIWVIGGGVIGSLFAAHLSRVAEVTLLCRRAEHAAAVSENGIRVSGRADFVGRPRASTDPAGLADAGFAIVATKANDVETAAAQLEGRLGDGSVMTVQNGLGAEEVETPQTVADRIRRALEVVPPERLVVAPDCGMKYLPRDSAYGKLESLVEGAKLASNSGS